MNQILDDKIINKSRNNGKWIKLAAFSILAVILVGIFYQQIVFGQLNMNDVFYDLLISFGQSLIVSLIGIVGNFIFNLFKNGNIEFIKTLHFYLVGITIGNSLWLIIMLAVIVISKILN